MSELASLLAAGRRIIESAARDLELGLHESACLSAHRGAVLVTEGWLRSRGQPQASASVHENVCLAPGAGPDVREAAARLDRHRHDEGSAHRSSAPAAGFADDSAAAVADARRVLSFVEEELGS